jgi:hypothetical protein
VSNSLNVSAIADPIASSRPDRTPSEHSAKRVGLVAARGPWDNPVRVAAATNESHRLGAHQVGAHRRWSSTDLEQIRLARMPLLLRGLNHPAPVFEHCAAKLRAGSGGLKVSITIEVVSKSVSRQSGRV